jgi:hypothetical protein
MGLVEGLQKAAATAVVFTVLMLVVGAKAILAGLGVARPRKK